MGRPRETPVDGVLLRLLEAAGASTAREAAEWLGANPNTANNWFKRKSLPPKWLNKASELSGKSVDWFLSSAPMAHGGQKSTYLVETKPTVLQTGNDTDLPTGALPLDDGDAATAPLVLRLERDGAAHRYEVIPRYSVLVSAGGGHGEVHEEQIGEIAFEVGWMQRNLGRSGRGFSCVIVRGDSMQPTLINGDEIIIDKHVVRVDVSGIYVIALRGDLLVKRVQRKLDGSLVVKGDNPAYEPETITEDRVEDFRVVGRMVWPRVR